MKTYKCQVWNNLGKSKVFYLKDSIGILEDTAVDFATKLIEKNGATDKEFINWVYASVNYSYEETLEEDL